MKLVERPADVPSGQHYMVLVFEKRYIHHEADERSRTAPGHGYPEYVEEVQSYRCYVTEDREDYIDFTLGLFRKNVNRKDVVPLFVQSRPSVTLSISFEG
jgi:hypothetical protein